ncbi:MAG: DUF983 domain-containing protein [Rhizobiaceae bacterium]|nr:DUF983 domain-containing protein [Rhizobiaceae bacterium]
MNVSVEQVEQLAERPAKLAMARGVRSKCPNCGKGSIFEKKLAVANECSECGEEFFHHRADDLPAYLNIFVVGHVVIGTMMAVMGSLAMGMWPLTFLTVTIAIVMAFLLMRPLKGLVVAAQWAFRMHGFGGQDD